MSDPSDIANWQRLSEHVTTSGQPTEEQLADIADLGIRHVIDLAVHDHELALVDEATSVAALGMRYTHIPVPFDEPTDEHWTAFCEAMRESEGEPVHVHCIVNYRVSAFMYRWHRDVEGMPEPDARALMEQQWRPHEVDHPRVRPWAAFVAADPEQRCPT
jgi:uncharacterized protein (TIGR01244 family)